VLDSVTREDRALVRTVIEQPKHGPPVKLVLDFARPRVSVAEDLTAPRLTLHSYGRGTWDSGFSTRGRLTLSACDAG
jgi:hypothetical protein